MAKDPTIWNDVGVFLSEELEKAYNDVEGSYTEEEQARMERLEDLLTRYNAEFGMPLHQHPTDSRGPTQP